MGVTVAPEVIAGLVPEATITLQVRSSAARVLLLAGMRAAAADLQKIDGLKYVGPPIPLPDGVMMVADLGVAPPRWLRGIPALIARNLAEAGAGDAELVLPANATIRYLPLRDLAPAARAVLRGPPPGPYGVRPPTPFAPGPHASPPGLLDLAADWLRGEHSPGARLTGLAVSVPVELDLDAIVPVLGPVLATGTNAVVVSTDFASTLAAAAIRGGHNSPAEAGFTATGGGPAGVVAALCRQRDLLLRHPDRLVWAGVSTEPDASDLLFPWWRDRDTAAGPRRPPVDQIPDIVVPDAMWWQLLSPGHLDRLGGPPPGAVEVSPDRYALTLGEPEQWLPGHPDRDALRERGRELLAGCLVSADEAFAMVRDRVRRRAAHRDGG